MIIAEVFTFIIKLSLKSVRNVPRIEEGKVLPWVVRLYVEIIHDFSEWIIFSTGG